MKFSSAMIEEALTEAPPDTFIPSPHQAAIKDFALTGQGSANVIAVAGSGKTTTLVWLSQYLSGNAIFTAYNKKIADEIGYRLAEKRITNVQAKTFHAIGLGAWKKLHPKVKVEGDKVRDLCEEQGVKFNQISTVSRLVSLAKNHGYGLEGGHYNEDWWSTLVGHFDLLLDYPSEADDEEAEAQLIEKARYVLKLSNNCGDEIIDFDDMIYLPLKYDAPFWRNDWVLVDEAQDTNPTRRMLAKRMLKPSGRLLAVGDPRQAIYGFTGADADAMELIAKEFRSIELPLTVTFRCPKAVVRHAQQWVSHISAAESAPEGSLRTIAAYEWRKSEMTREQLDRNSVILCRYTKPLVSLAFECIRKQIPCHVEGKEIGKGLIALVKKMHVADLRDLHTKLNEHLKQMSARWREQHQEAKIEALSDRIETIFVIMENVEETQPETEMSWGNGIQRLIAAIESLFGDTEGGKQRDLTLSTVHKAKGREWDKVYLWGRDAYMPSKYAKQDWQKVQEDNLIYVAVTRAKKELIEVSVGV